MRKFLIITTAFAILAGASAFSASVTEVSLGYSNDFTVAAIKIEGQVRFTHQTEVAKDGKPFRIIVDILAATHEIGARVFEDIPECRIQRIRTSQYSVSPEKIVRVVFDMKGETAYRIDSDENSVGVFMYDKDATPFATWSSSSFVEEEEPEPVQPEIAQTPVTKSDSAPRDPASVIASINKALDQDRMSSLEPESSSERDEPAKSTEPIKRTKVEVGKPTQTEEELGPVFAKSSDEKTGDKKTTSHPTVEKKTEAAPAKVKESKSKTKSLTPDAGKVKGTAKISSKPPTTTVERKKPETKVSTAKKKTKPVKPVKSSDKKKTTPKKTTLPATPGKTDSKKLAEKKSTKATRPTARFRRSPASSRRIKGTLVAQFPKRLVIKYKGKRYRDPFETLINETKTHNNPIEKRVPNVEGLKLVGILETIEDGNRALFEDQDGYGYILKTGDKVQKGYVLRVSKDRVYFQIFEYGWSRTVALRMDTN